MSIRRIPAPALLLALAACGAPEAALVPISEDARAAPAPRLTETARFDEALAAAGPDAERLGGDAEALAGRVDALRARAAGLAGPVVDPAMVPRLQAAAAGE